VIENNGQPAHQPRVPRGERAVALALAALLDGWMASGAERQAAIRHEVAANGFREEVLLGILRRAKSAKTRQGLAAWAFAARDYAQACDLPTAHPLASLTAAYLAEAARVSGERATARERIHGALSAVHAIEDPILKAEVLTVAAKICIHFGDAEARSAGVDHCFDAGQRFLERDDSASRAEVLLFQAVALSLEEGQDLEWLPADLLVEALSLVSPQRFQPWMGLVLAAVGHGFCDEGSARGAADVLLLGERLGSAGNDPLVELSRKWLEARRAELEGERDAAVQSYTECRTLVATWGQTLRDVLDYRIELARGLAG
jgi:hypothetical protein